MATWFTADTHFGHAKVLGGRHARPFASVTEMDNALVGHWNATVAPDDECWHLGDFSTYQDARLETVFHRLHGRKHLVLGNHDEENLDVGVDAWGLRPISLPDIERRMRAAPESR